MTRDVNGDYYKNQQQKKKRQSAKKKLVIVESPTKAKTIQKYLVEPTVLLLVRVTLEICQRVRWGSTSITILNLTTSLFVVRAKQSRN